MTFREKLLNRLPSGSSFSPFFRGVSLRRCRIEGQLHSLEILEKANEHEGHFVICELYLEKTFIISKRPSEESTNIHDMCADHTYHEE